MAIALQWSEAYSIEPAIDDEHKRLFTLANYIFAIADPASEAAKLKDAVHTMYEYLEYHFAHEELLMRQVGFPEYDRHVALHKAITVEMNEVMRARDDSEELALRLRRLVTERLLTHTLREDRKIRPYTRASTAQRLGAREACSCGQSAFG